jgi:uncharacterized phiE125 gp8 family phage protein
MTLADLLPATYRRDRPSRVAVSVVTAPTLEPIALEEAKAWLKVDDATDDSEIEQLLLTARHLVEEETGLKLLTQTVRQTMDWLPCADEAIQLYVGPVQSIASVTVYDSADAATVLAGSAYLVDSSRRAPRLVLTSGSAWPTNARDRVTAVVQLVAGYAAPELIPAPLKHAMRLMLEGWYDDCETDRKVAKMGVAWEALLRPYRLEWL